MREEVRDQLRVRDAILDGEVLALDDEGRLDFHLLMRRPGQFHYAAFDLLWLNGQDLRGMPLVIRRRRLEKLIPEPMSSLSRVLTVDQDGRALFEAAQQRKADPYEAGMSWLKIKNPAYTQMEGRGDLFHKPR